MENKRNHRGRKPGRPPQKPDYDPEEIMRELLDAVVEVYREKNEIKATALELDLPPNKVMKLLITAKVLCYQETEQIQELLNNGKTMAEVQEKLHLSRAAINTYLPYSKCVYKAAEISQNAERAARYRDRKIAEEVLHSIIEEDGSAGMAGDAVEMDSAAEDALWQCIIAFQHYPFHTSSGLPFTYTLKTGRGGSCTKELFISRRENSKSLAWSSVRIAYQSVVEKRGTVITGPKELANVRGISYIYSLFWRFGVIKVPGKVEERLCGLRR